MTDDVVICPDCGAENSPENDYCVRCGHPLTEATEDALDEAGSEA